MDTKVINKRWLAVFLSFIMFITTIRYEGTIQANGEIEKTTEPEFSVTVKTENGEEAFQSGDTYFVKSQNIHIILENAAAVKELKYSEHNNISTGGAIPPVVIASPGENRTSSKYELTIPETDVLYYFWIITDDNMEKVFFKIMIDTKVPVISSIGEVDIESETDFQKEYWQKNKTITINVNDGEGSGVEELKYSINNDYEKASAVLENEQGKFQFDLDSQNEIYYVWVCDKLGNHSENPIKTGYDRTAPEVEEIPDSYMKTGKEVNKNIYYTNKDIVKVKATDAGEGTVKFHGNISEDEKNPEVISVTDKDGYYEMPFDDKYISIEILDGLDNSAGKIKKDKSVDYVVKKGKETLIPDNNSGKKYTVHAEDLLIISNEEQNGSGIKSVEFRDYNENIENPYMAAEISDEDYKIKINKNNIVEVRLIDNLGNTEVLQFEYTDIDSGLLFVDKEDKLINPNKNEFYINEYNDFKIFHYSKKIEGIYYWMTGEELKSQIDLKESSSTEAGFLFSDFKKIVEQTKDKLYFDFNIELNLKGADANETYKVIFDKEEPVFEILNPIKEVYVNENTIAGKRISLINAVDKGSGIKNVKYFINGNLIRELAWSETLNLDISKLRAKLSEGDNSLRFVLTDKAGNESLDNENAVTVIKYDTVAPAFISDYAHDGETIGKNTDYAIKIEARDETSKIKEIRCLINEGDPKKKEEHKYSFADNVENTVNHTIKIKDILEKLSEGSNTVKIVVMDGAGNESCITEDTDQEAVYTIVKDTTAPDFTVEYLNQGKPFGENTKAFVFIKGIKDASSIKRISYIINKGQPEEKRIDYNNIKNTEHKLILKDHIDDFTEGENTITIEVEDVFENTGIEILNGVIKDTEAPVFKTSYSGEKKINTKNTKEKIYIKNISDMSTVTQITCFINRGSKREEIYNKAEYNGEKNCTISIQEIMDRLEEEENTVQIEVADEVGNIGKSEVYIVKKDTIGPKFQSVFENNGKNYITKKTSAKITVKNITDKSEIKKITFFVKKGEADGKGISEEICSYIYEGKKDYILDIQDKLNYLSEGINTISIEVADEAGNISDKEYIVRKDTVAPNITLTYDEKGYITNGTTAKVTIKGISDSVSGVKSITYYINDEKVGEEDYSRNKDYSFSLVKYWSKLSEGDNEIRVVVKDKADNDKIRTCKVKKDTELPHATFKYKYNKEAINLDYDAQILISSVKDRLSGIKNVSYSVGSHSGILTPENNIYTLNINELLLSQEEILHQGENPITITVTDTAGNHLDETFNICVDTVAPEITDTQFEEKVKAVHDGNNYYVRETAILSIQAVDNKDLKAVVLIMGDKEETCHVSGETAKADFRIPGGFKGKLSVYAIDRVGNVSPVREIGGTIIETEETHNSYSGISFRKAETALRDTAGNELYRENQIPVTIDVTDNFSGIKRIEWNVTSADMEAAKNENGYIVINGTELSGNLEQISIPENSNSEEINKHIVRQLSKKIFITDNSNNITLTVSLTDNAGNTSSNQIVFSNDTAAPVITITYDNNAPDAGNGQMFNQERTATIEVAERNFDPNRMIIDITNTDNVIPNITGWTLKPGTGNQDDTVYTTTITYSADGDYVFNMSFQDMAGHNAQINFGNSIAPQVFTVDKTKPILNIAYDNNDGNGAYYKDSRIATITIDEHNFSEDRLNLTVMKNGSNETPQSTGWNNNGDTHSMTLIFAEEAEYSIMVSYTDMAGNMADNTVNNSFFVDKSEPQVLLSGIENQKGYQSGQIGFEISGTDIYFDTLNVLLIRIDNFGNRTTINLNKAAIENGEKVSVDNLAQDGIYQLSYTATDKSARNVGETIIFSVNRNGSTYMLSDQVMKLNKSYVKSIDYDIVIKEINVNELLMDSVILTLSRGSSSKELKEGVDFTVQKNTGSEQWCEYVYIIKKSCFTEDGLYSLSISSKDISGNISVSDLEAKASELSFVVDKTSPICNVMNLKSGTTYATNSKRVEFTVSDNIMLSKVSVLLNGTELLNLTEETLRQIADNGENISFDIPNSDSVQTVVIQYADKAGNEGIMEIKDFYVTTNPWIRYTNNTPLMVSTIAGAVTVLGLAAFILMFRKKAGRH